MAKEAWPPPAPRADAATLQAFVTVARLGTVGRAAEAIGRAQPSISARIAALETAWETRLFRRGARGMALTPEGARLLPRAEAVLAALEDLDREAGLPVSRPDLLRIGAGDALGRVLLPTALRKLAGERRRLEVRVLEGSGPRLLAALESGEIDVALVVLASGEMQAEGQHATPFLDSPVDVLLPPGRRTRGRRSVSPTFLESEAIVALQPDSAFRRHVGVALAARHIPLRPSVEVGNLSLVRRFVSAGFGVAPVPAVAFDPDAPGPEVERRHLSGIPPVRYHWTVRAGVPVPEAAERLLEILTGGQSGSE
jgi:LysR family hydrogen peroxide-inducible transcriptional activator